MTTARAIPDVPIAPPGTADDRDPSRSAAIRARAVRTARGQQWVNTWGGARRKRHLTLAPEPTSARPAWTRPVVAARRAGPS